MKKLAALAVVLALCTGLLFCASAEAPEPETFACGDFTYILREDGTAEIVKCSGKAAELDIPEELDGIRVTKIGDEAFSWCSSLESVSIPDSVTEIGVNPFTACYHLVDIRVSPEHPALAVTEDRVLISRADMRLVCCPNAPAYTEYAIPEGIQIIGDKAFSWCSSLESVTIPDSVAAIGDKAFTGCKALGDITIPDSVTDIGINPFTNCDKLTDIRVSPDHPALAVTNGVLISRADRRAVCCPYAGAGTECAVPEGVAVIGDYAFEKCRSLTEITLPDGLTGIGERAFSECGGLKQINLPEGVTDIGRRAFSECRGLESVTLPDSLANIGEEAFFCCTALAGTVTIPGRVAEIGDGAFYGCESLAGVTIGDGVTRIGIRAFYDCAGLTEISIPDSVASIGERAFFVYRNSEYTTIPGLTVTVGRESYAKQYCEENGLRFLIPESAD